MNERIALVAIKTDRVVYPLSILYVGSVLKNSGFDVKIYNILPNRIEDNIQEIIDSGPLFAGFSVFTGIHTAVAARMSQELKKRCPSLTIVWGGIHPSLVPRQCLEEDFVDITVMGEGEETAAELALALKQKSELKGIKGIGFKEGGEIFLNEARPLIKNLDNYGLDWSLMDIGDCIDKTTDGLRSISYMTSRGCPFNCGFCYNLAFNKRRWRPFSFEHVVKEIMYMKKIGGIEGVSFHDDNFMTNVPRALKIISFLKDNGIKCLKLEMRVDTLNEEVLSTVYKLGVRSIFIGWESGSNRVLKLINKGITREEILDKFKLLRRFPRLAVSAPAIIGFPTETMGEVCQTIDLGLRIAKLVPSNHIIFQTFLPYPGTELYPLAVKEGLVPPKRSLDWEGYNTFYGTMKLEWLPWATKRTPRDFYSIDKYGKLLNHATSSTLLRSIGKKICYYLARFRLKYKFFYLPVEIYILHRFNRYYLDLEGKPIKR